MPVEIEMKPDKSPFTVYNMRFLTPYKVHSYKALTAGGEKHARFEAVKEKVFVGDVVVVMNDAQVHTNRIFLCREGMLLPTWHSDYLLFEDADEIQRIVIAKPENK